MLGGLQKIGHWVRSIGLSWLLNNHFLLTWLLKVYNLFVLSFAQQNHQNYEENQDETSHYPPDDGSCRIKDRIRNWSVLHLLCFFLFAFFVFVTITAGIAISDFIAPACVILIVALIFILVPRILIVAGALSPVIAATLWTGRIMTIDIVVVVAALPWCELIHMLLYA